MILEEKLITLRKSQGFSQEDLANQLDVSRQAIYKWEAGQAKPDISKLKLLSSLYNVSIDNLLNDNEDIIRMNTPKLNYGKVMVKKVLSDDAGEKDNQKLYPEEEKKFKTRKLVLGIAKAVTLISGILCALLFILAVINADSEKLNTYSSAISVFFIIWIISAIVKGILNKTLFPKVQFARTYFKDEKEKAEKLLNENYQTVLPLQPDLLAWFVYDTKTNSFGFYFDGEMQFLCPINNYATINLITFDTLISITVKYFNEDGQLCEYKFSLSFWRKFWQYELKKISLAQVEQYQLSTFTKNNANAIKQRLDIEKSRI